MGFKKIELKWLVLFLFLLLLSYGSRGVLRNTSLKENKVVSKINEQEKKSDSSFAKIQKLSENIYFELEPIGDKLAHFVYIVGKDTIRVETSGKLLLNNAKNKEKTEVLNKSNSETKKEIKSEEKSKVKNKEKEVKRENNSFQFILIGIILTIALQFGWKVLKDKYFI